MKVTWAGSWAPQEHLVLVGGHRLSFLHPPHPKTSYSQDKSQDLGGVIGLEQGASNLQSPLCQHIVAQKPPEVPPRT